VGQFSRPELRELRKKNLVPGRIQNKQNKPIYVAMKLGPLVAASKYLTMSNRLWQVLLCLTLGLGWQTVVNLTF